MNNKRKRLRILVADDHELVRRGIRDLLQAQRGWKVVGEAADGKDAVEKVLKLRPDIAILDVTMPEKDGLEATREIRQGAPETRLLILTMHESDQMVRRALDAGARGCVLKSDMAAQLVRAVKNLMRGEVSLTPKVSEIVLEGFLKGEAAVNGVAPSQPRPTPREMEIIQRLAEGKANKEIASELGITLRTVQTHRGRIMVKMGFHSLSDLIHFAIRGKIVRKADF